MLVFVLHEAWPSFSHNGLGWFGPGGNVDSQIQSIFTSGDVRGVPQYVFHAWPILWSTILTTVFGVGLGFICSLFVSVFIVEFAPEWLKRILEPVVRLLASIPSVIYGLIGVLVRGAVHRQPPDHEQRGGVGLAGRSRSPGTACSPPC